MTARTDQKMVALSASSILLRQGYTLCVGVLTASLFSRVLGPAGSGLFATTLLLPSLMNSLSNLGGGAASVYFVGKGQLDPADARRHLDALALMIGLCISVLTAAALLRYSATVFPNVPRTAIYLAIAIFPALLINSYQLGLLQAVEEFGAFNLVMMVPPTATCLIGVCLLLILHLGPIGALWSTLIGNYAAVMTANVLLTRRIGSGRGLPISRATMNKLLSYGAKSSVSDLLQFMAQRADLFFVNFYVGRFRRGFTMRP